MRLDFRHQTKSIRTALFAVAVLLLCGQIGGVLHAYDFDSHVDDHLCELCVRYSSLGASIIAPTHSPDALSVDVPVPESPTGIRLVTIREQYQIRAPPPLS